MNVSITRKTEADGFTEDQDYPVLGYVSEGLIILDDNDKFVIVGYARLDPDWSVATDAKKPKKTIEGDKE